MRGDSLRDLYAKTLAVLGLGLLAGAGAIVDYWPVGSELPGVARAAGLGFGAPAIPNNLSLEIPAPVIRLAAYRAAVVKTGPRFSESFRVRGFVDVVTPAVVIEPEAPPAPADFMRVDNAIPEALLSTASFDLGAPPEPSVSENPALQGADDGHRFLVGAIRKTRESLRDARGYLGGKFQGMVGAFRKVSPFFDVSGFLPLHE